MTTLREKVALIEAIRQRIQQSLDLGKDMNSEETAMLAIAFVQGLRNLAKDCEDHISRPVEGSSGLPQAAIAPLP